MFAEDGRRQGIRSRQGGAGKRLLVGGDEAVADGVADKTGDVVDVETGHEVCAVGLGCLETDVEFGGDFFGGISFCDKLKDFLLARGEKRSGGFADG